jgi:hypothetical protein
VTCGITFTFGGVGITDQGEVKDTSGNVISGLSRPEKSPAVLSSTIIPAAPA